MSLTAARDGIIAGMLIMETTATILHKTSLRVTRNVVIADTAIIEHCAMFRKSFIQAPVHGYYQIYKLHYSSLLCNIYILQSRIRGLNAI